MQENQKKMFKKEELESIFNQDINNYTDRAIEDAIIFIIDLEVLGIEDDKYLKDSTFQLGETGLLELVILANGGIMEYHKKVSTLDDLKYAVEHLDEWEDDWNED